jgi:hypothetical protein
MPPLSVSLLIADQPLQQFQLNSADADVLRATLTGAPAAIAAVANLVARGTGTQYGGFRVPDLHVKVWLDLAFYDNGTVSSVPGLEGWIFDRLPGPLADGLTTRLRSIFTVPRPPRTPASPAFATAPWTGQELNAHCYPYALNIHSHPDIEPGCTQPHAPALNDCASTIRACLADRLARWVPPNSPAGNGHFVALFSGPPGILDPGEPFHFMRLDSNGTWSQKSSRQAPENQDVGKPIIDPRLFVPIEFEFCAFLWVSENAARRVLDIRQQAR